MIFVNPAFDRVPNLLQNRTKLPRCLDPVCTPDGEKWQARAHFSQRWMGQELGPVLASRDPLSGLLRLKKGFPILV